VNTVLFVLDLLINTLWQAALIALAVWTVFRFRARINAATRHAIWWCTLAVILILPFTRQIASVVQPSRPPGTTFRRVQDTVKTTSAAAPEVVVLRLPASPESRWPGLLVFLWMAIALSRLMQLVRSYFYFRRVRRRAMASPIRLPHLKRVAIVLISPEIESPMAVGFRPPAVLLPASSIGNLSEEQREHILLHEAAHLAAYDDWTNLLLRFLRALLNLHPVAIGIIRQIECERELACDDWVVERTGSARPYARTLAHMLEAGSASRGPVLASGFLGGKSRIGRRIEILLRRGRTFSARIARREALVSAAVLLLLIVAASFAPHWIALAQGTPDWQTAAGGNMTFEVASVKLDPGPFRPPNFPLDAGNSFVSLRSNEPPRGRFSADFPLAVYITFAYKLTLTPNETREMLAHVPKWVGENRYAIEAKAPGNPTKDQMRLMMQSLLAERFHLALHFESRDMPALAMELIKPGKTEPKLRPHGEGPPCDTPAASDIFPAVCDTYGMTIQQGKRRAGSRNTTIQRLAEAIPTFGSVDRPVVDRTGLAGTYDFTLEWVPDSPQPVDTEGPAFIDALREQLGLKLESTKAAIRTPVIDRIDRPTEN